DHAPVRASNHPDARGDAAHGRKSLAAGGPEPRRGQAAAQAVHRPKRRWRHVMTAIGVSASDIAIVGMVGWFPGASNVDDSWDYLRVGVGSIIFFFVAELLAFGVDPEQLDQFDYVCAVVMLDDSSLFDAALFGYAPYEAQIIDPQQRLFLECAWT